MYARILRGLMGGVVAMGLLGACANLEMHPTRQLAIVELSYIEIVNDLDFACTVGDIPEQVCIDAVPLIESADSILDAAHGNIDAGGTSTALIDELRVVVRELRLRSEQ